MGDTHDDPTDHSRTTQPHAGIVMKDNFFWPGLVLLVVSMFGLISAAAAAAYRHYNGCPPRCSSPFSALSLERCGSSWRTAASGAASKRSGTPRIHAVGRAHALANPYRRAHRRK